MFKKICSVFLVAIFTIMLSLPSSAEDVQTINYWYANEGNVGYTLLDCSYYLYNLRSGNSTFTTRINNAITRAENQWEAVLPLSIYSASVNYALFGIYAGTRADLLETFPDLLSNDSGLTYTTPNKYNTYRKTQQ